MDSVGRQQPTNYKERIFFIFFAPKNTHIITPWNTCLCKEKINQLLECPTSKYKSVIFVFINKQR